MPIDKVVFSILGAFAVAAVWLGPTVNLDDGSPSTLHTIACNEAGYATVKGIYFNGVIVTVFCPEGKVTIDGGGITIHPRAEPETNVGIGL